MARKTEEGAGWKPTKMCNFSCREDMNEKMRVHMSELKVDNLGEVHSRQVEIGFSSSGKRSGLKVEIQKP